MTHGQPLFEDSTQNMIFRNFINNSIIIMLNQDPLNNKLTIFSVDLLIMFNYFRYTKKKSTL